MLVYTVYTRIRIVVELVLISIAIRYGMMMGCS